MANNRELSQFASFVEVNDTSRHISVASTSGQYVGIGSTQPTVKVDIVGDVKVSGSFTAPSGSIANLNGTNLYYTGLSTVGNFRITPAGVGATVGNAGIVTYYGDGRYLDISQNTSGGIGIQTGNTLIGYGVTFIEFRGPGVSTGFYNAAAGIATVYFQGGGGGGGAIGIGSTFPGTPLSVLPAPANGDLFFHIDYGRTFIYYNEVTLGVGSSAFWVDSAPFNQGLIGTLVSVAFTTGSAAAPSWYFVGDAQTGVFSPGSGELTIVSAGASVFNTNEAGIIVTGVTTSTKSRVGAATTFSEDLIVNGSARVTGILTVGTSSIVINGNTDTITVGSGATINGSTGAITAATFTGNVTGNLTGTASTATAAATAYGLTGSISGANLTNLNASNLASGTVPDARFPATLPAASGANLTNLNASNIASGTVPTARLASGTANSGTYLRGDSTWAAISSGLTISDDTSTNATRYLTFTSATSGTVSSENVSSSKLTFNPSTGKLTVTGFTASNNLVAPVGNAAARVSTQGSIRYNSEYSQIEFYDGTTWVVIKTQPYVPNPADVGLFSLGSAVALGGTSNIIEFITISTTGNAQDFGDLSIARESLAACSSSTRGIWAGGDRPSFSSLNIIDYINLSTSGNAADFGDLFTGRYFTAGCSSSTRGLFGGGRAAPAVTASIDYITIASTGDASSFGNLTVARMGLAACASPTRGVFCGGFASPANTNTIDYVTIASTGNATDFGDLISPGNRDKLTSCSNSTRGLFGGGNVPGTGSINNIDYITIASTGNSSDFGDLITIRQNLMSTSNSTRGVFAGGYSPSPGLNAIDYVTIASTGNATDFGDLSSLCRGGAGCSSAHGGLQ